MMENNQQGINIEWFNKLRDQMLKEKDFYATARHEGERQIFIDMYTTQGHFLYELLQNADDAKATEVEIELHDDGLTFTHNGSVRFTLSDFDTEKEDKKNGRLGHINAITAIGFSNKNGSGTTENKIGKFGLGFKSVYNYTNTPHIYDKPYCFKMDRDFVPELLEDKGRLKQGKTVFYLPFDKEEGNSQSAFNDLKSELADMSNVVPQLFLNHIQQIYWKTGEETFLISKQLEEVYDSTFAWMDAEKYVLKLGKYKDEHIIMLSGRFNLNQYGIHIVRIAYWLNDDGSIVISKRRPGLYSYFPLKLDFETCYAAHAPFELTSNRENYKENEYNNLLVKSIGDLAAHGLVALKAIGLNQGKRIVDSNVFYLIDNDQKRPNKDIYSRQYGKKIKYLDNACEPIFEKEAIFTNRAGEYVSADKVIWGKPELKELFDDAQLQKLFGNQIDFADLPEWDKYLTLSKIRKFNDSELSGKLTSDFMSSQDEGWLEKFYQYILDKKLCDNWNSPLSTAPCVRVKSGIFVKPWDSSDKAELYFDDGSDISEDKLIDDELYETCKPFRDLIDRIGFMKPDEMQVLLNRTEQMTKYGDQEIKDFQVDILLYLKNNSSQKGNKLIEELKDKQFMILCHDTNDTKDAPLQRKLIHEAFIGNSKAITYFKLAGLQKSFICWDFYADLCSSKGIEKNDFEDFLHKMGVQDRPQWIKEEYKVSTSNREQTLLDFELTKRDISHKYSDLIIHRSYLDCLFSVLYILPKSDTDEHVEISHYIWDLLSDECTNLQYLLTDTLEYVPFRGRPDIPRYIMRYNITFEDLISKSWLRIGDKWRSIEEGVYREDLLNNGYLANEELFKQLGIEKSPNVKEEEIIATMSAEAQKSFKLGDVAQNYVDDPEELEKLLKFAIEAKAAKEKKEQQATSGETNRPPQSSYPTSTGTGHGKPLTGKDFEPTEPNDGNKGPKGTSGENKGPKKDDSTAMIADTLAGFDEKYEMQRKDLERVEELRELCKPEDKYKYSWFKALMELEAMSYGTTEDAAKVRKSINILFKRVAFIPERHDLLILEDASKYIPAIIEDIDGITVRFTLRGGATKDVTFDVASVRDNRLLLKGNTDAGKFIDSIRDNASLIDKATIDIDKPIEIIKNWKRLIDNLENLGFSDEQSLKESLRKDIKFIFGPPGTGKTTLLARRIKKLIEDNERCKILVLTPTNKACDVLAEKILDECPEDYTWLWRFVSTMSQRLEDAGIVRGRKFDISSQEKVCLVSTMARYAFDSLNNVPINSMKWDYVIIDEASMIPLYQIITPLFNYNISNIVIAGDPFQIEPIVKMEEWMGENIYSIVNLNDFKLHTTEPVQYDVECLMTQYRSIPVVGEIYNNYLYGGELSHNRTSDKHRLLKTGLEENPLNIISFPVTNESIFEAHRLSGSNIHVYSVIFTVEMLNYITDNLNAEHPGQEIRIGVVSPYSSEVQAIQKMYNQCSKYKENIEVLFGTSHGFQGDECDIMIVVVNPPASGMVRAADLTFINKPNILNVAISRAKDYLYVLMPDRVYKHFDKMTQLKVLGDLMMKGNCKSYTSFQIEKTIFGNSGFIEGNTFVSSHQTTNVYSNSSAKYDIRIDENAIDITVN